MKRRGSSAIRAALTTAFCLGAFAPAAALDSLRFRVQGGGDDLAEVLGATSLLVENRRTGVNSPSALLAAARADYARIVEALYAEGRFGGTVSIRIDGREAADIDPLATIDRIRAIEVIVVPGPLYRFSEARVAPLARRTELPDDFALGRPARTTVIEDAALAAVEGWRAVGNAKAGISGERITANHATDSVAARIEVAPGPRLRFGELSVRGRSGVSDRRIRKIAGLPEGETYSPDDVERSARRLRETGVFRSVVLTEADEPNPNGTLDVVAQVSDQKKRRFGFGAEIESTEGATLSAFWMHRNLLGGAERLRFDAEISGIGGESGGTDYSLAAKLGRPATPNAKTDAYVSASLEHLEEPEFTSDIASIGFGFEREINDVASTRIGLEYRYSDVTDDTGDEIYRQFFLPLGGTYDRRDDRLNATDGYYIDLEISPFLGIGGSESGARMTLDARGFEGFGKDDRFVVAARLQAGSILGASITGLPNDLRFTSGGSGTVRGHDYQSLDLALPGGARTGGRSLLGLQTELRAGVTENLQIVGFLDWATIGPDSMPGSGGESQSGAGLGLRYETGIGPIRLDVGVPVSGPDDSSSFQVYIGIGQAF